MRNAFRLTWRTLLFSLAWCSWSAPHAASLAPSGLDRQVEQASGIFRGTVVALHSYQDTQGLIYTWALLRVDEVFKGTLPGWVGLVHRGGIVGNRGEADDFAPRFIAGDERLVFVSRRQDGSLFSMRGEGSAWLLQSSSPGVSPDDLAAGRSLLERLRGLTAGGPLAGADLSDPTASAPAPAENAAGANPAPSVSGATNLLTGGDGIPARHVLPDRGEGIPYLVDADYLPAGITLNQALAAVRGALGAWTNACSVRYAFAGMQSFGQAAGSISASDGVLRIQLHDHYHYIGSGSGSGDTLGVGGQAWTIGNLSSGWTTGGNVAGNDFHRVIGASIVLAHTNVFMQNITNFTEVLTHEIGHTIGLGHSSQNPSEPNPLLKQAIMYYAAHGDGRGATLNQWDTNVSNQVHPHNTPPYNYDRNLDGVSSPGAFSSSGVNTIQVRGYDLQGGALTLATSDASTINGSFSVTGSNITYTFSAWYGDATPLDPTGNSFYDIIYARYSDGVNAAPYSRIRLLSINSDTYSEGIPDWWRTTYFGNASPSAGPRRHAGDDYDGDGFSNLTEWRLGSNPTNPASNLKITYFAPTNIQWQAKPYEVYEIYGSSNLMTWSRAMNPVVPTNAAGSATPPVGGAARQFFRVLKVP